MSFKKEIFWSLLYPLVVACPNCVLGANSCGVLNRKGHHWLMYLNVWLLENGITWQEFWGVAYLTRCDLVGRINVTKSGHKNTSASFSDLCFFFRCLTKVSWFSKILFKFLQIRFFSHEGVFIHNGWHR